MGLNLFSCCCLLLLIGLLEGNTFVALFGATLEYKWLRVWNCRVEGRVAQYICFNEYFHLFTFQTPVIFLLIFLIFHLQFVEYYKLLLNV